MIISSSQLLGFGISVLEGIDPNAENFVSAGILHTRNQQVGILVRLEPNKQAQVCYMYIYEPPREKTNNVVSDQVRHKPACTSTEKS